MAWKLLIIITQIGIIKVMYNQKGNGLVVLIGLVAVALIVGIFLALNYRGAATPHTYSSVSHTPLPVNPSSTPHISVKLQPLPTTNWKTLESQYFSLMYSPSWKSTGKSGGCLSGLDLDTPLTTWICINGPSNGTPEQAVDELSKNLTNVNQKIASQKNFTFNNLTGIEIETNGDLPQIDAFVSDPTVSHSSYLNVTLSSHNKISDQDKLLFETLLSTIKFHDLNS